MNIVIRNKRATTATISVRFTLTDEEIAKIHATSVDGATLSNKVTNLAVRFIESFLKAA